MNRDRNAGQLQMPTRKTETQYDLTDFARKHGLTAVKAREILDRAGTSRESADLLALRRKPIGSPGY